MANGKRAATAAGDSGASTRAKTTSNRAAGTRANGAISSDEQVLQDVLAALQAVGDGDFDVRMTTRRTGIAGEIARAFNTAAQRRSELNKELAKVARLVGREGRMGERVGTRGGGGWAEGAASVNSLIDDLVRPTNEVARVLGAVARGDLTQHMALTIEGRPVKGEFQRIGTVVNAMVDQLSSFAEEVTRVAREVGTEGKLGGQAQVEGVSGTWKALTLDVNELAANLTGQVRNIAQVTTAVARGDLSQKITVDARGEILQLKETVNTMVDQLGSFADEVTRVALEVGTEGMLGGQARVKGVSGTWADLTDSVNLMAGNLTTQVRNIAQVSAAVAHGDLTQRVTVEAKGEVAALAETINATTGTLRAFADEVTRVAREVGTEGMLGGQADVPGVSGTWKDLTDSVNVMARNLTTQVRGFAEATTAVARGDLTKRVTVDAKGEVAALADTMNSMTETLRSFAHEVTRVAREVGTEGKLGGQADVPGVSGTWKDLTDNVNQLAGNLTGQVRNIAQVTTAVAQGDLTQKITVEARGEVAELKSTINTMVDQLSSFAGEVTRVAREVGTEGRLGGQADVPGVSGTWKDLTDNVNQLAGNLTGQVRNIAQVTTAVAQGDLSQKVTVDVRGELLELKDTVNTMVDQLGSFAAEVTRVAREVGTEGRLGGQAKVEGVSGTWKDLTDNVNQLAGNLTTQVRAIAEVSSAVTQGDLTRSINVEAAGELEELKDTINQMIANLRETTKLTTDQDWLKSNLARISAALQGQRDLRAVAQLIISELAPLVDAQQGAIFLAHQEPSSDIEFRLLASYGFNARKGAKTRWQQGEGLVGQAVLEKIPIRIADAPSDYIRITSGLGEAVPVEIVVMPVLFEDEVLAVIELASLHPFTEISQALLGQLVETFGVVLATILATSRTEELLMESQRLTQELQSQSEELQAQQDELRRSNVELEDQARSLKASEELLQTQQEELQGTNAELEEKAALLVEQKQSIEVKNTEIELARRALEERAEQLALSSRYKSEFLANMSHELRTPLNSLLILAKLLGENPEGNLTPKQVEFAQSIHGAGADLLDLISDILDLSKVEAGKLDLAPAPVDLSALAVTVEQVFLPLADQKGLGLEVDIESGLPELVTDEQRLSQVLNNLLGNAVKFTDAGTVSLRVRPASKDMVRSALLRRPQDEVLAFEVRDTGIGIAEDKLAIIFEAFQQADGTTSRRYGGTGLGLSISREIAHLLGGELQVQSTAGQGSVFTLLLPTRFPETAPRPPDGASGSADAWLLPAPPSTGPGPLTGPSPGPLLQAEDDVDDDRATIEEGDRVLLLVAADGELVSGAAAAGRERGFKVVIAGRADAGLELARELRPDAIVLDAQMPGVDGLAVLEELKRLGETRHIPVHVLSSGGQRQTALSAGAIAYLEKPVSPSDLGAAMAQLVHFLDAPVRRLLVVEDDERERASIIELITGGAVDIEAVGVGSSEEAIAMLEDRAFDCMVLDLELAQTSGFGLLEQVKGDGRWRDMPVIVYTGRELTRQEETRLRKYAETIIVKDARSPERLLDETALFLHRVESGLPREKRRMIEQLHSADAVFEGKRILIVDDDVRNVFALTSAFEGRGMVVEFAENGREGIEALDQHPDVDLVLMDIMMPEMDGYEAMRAIRQREELKHLPVIALTAKAMKGDREHSIAAGASDYITKPVDVDQLLSLMRVWLYR